MFNKDLLIVDLETTGLDSWHHEIIQIGAVRLDRKTLKETGAWMSFVKPRHWNRRSRESMKHNSITWNDIKEAPSLKAALTEFERQFPADEVIIGNYGPIMDIDFLKVGYRQAKKRYPYDYHVFNIWPLCYVYAAKHKLLKNGKRHSGFRLDDLIAHFKIDVDNRHDALVDARVEAEVFKRILKSK